MSTNMDSSNISGPYRTGANAIVLPVFAIFALLINLVPFRLLYRVKNLAGCTLIITVAISNLISVINSLLWPNDDFESWYNGVGLCDIEVQIKYPLYTLIATSLCSITRSLARALDTDNATLHESKGMKRRRLMFDVLFCFTVPFFQLTLHYIPSDARFGIYPVYGCLTFFDASWPTIVIMYMWPPIFSVLNCYYAVLVIHRIRKHRNTFASTLSSSGSGLSPRRFLKLFLLSIILLLVYLPLTVYYLYVDIPPHLYPYSWSAIHDPATWNPIEFYHSWDGVASQYDGWAGIGTAVAIFLFFGMNNEAIDIYCALLVECGLARCWPSLTQSRQQPPRRGSTSSTSSWRSKLDVVSRAMNYLEHGSRKGSGFESKASTTISSDKSFRHSDHMAFSTKSALTSSTITEPTSNILSDVNTHAPTPAHFLRPETILPKARKPSLSFFSTFRTHINLPVLPAMHSSRAHLSAHNLREVDLESGLATRRADIKSVKHRMGELKGSGNGTVATKIWSAEPTPVGTLAPQQDQ